MQWRRILAHLRLYKTDVMPSNMNLTIFGKNFSSFSIGLIAITLIGFVMRVLGARHELWLDEIWTLRLLDNISSWHEIFWNIPYNNNHPLNSLWLWYVGKDAHPILQRLASILLGTATIPIVALSIRRHASEAAGVAAALIFACGHIFVHFGSEARGYAGLVLMTVLCADAADRLIAQPQRRALAFRFALFAALGSFFHLTMIVSIGVIWMAATAIVLTSQARIHDKWLAIHALTIASMEGVLPAIASIGIAGHLNGYLFIGDQQPFSFIHLAEGLAGAARSTLGLSAALPDVPTLLIVAGLAIPALFVSTPRMRAISAVAIFLLPALESWWQPANLYYPRFHLPAAVFLALLASVGLGALWDCGGWRKLLAAMLALAGLLGHATFISDLFLSGRGAYEAAVMKMLKDGPASFDGNFHFETGLVVQFHVARLGKVGPALALVDWKCGTEPTWYVVTQSPDKAVPLAEEMQFGPESCPARFQLVEHYPSARLSGYNWSLYRHSPQTSSRLDQGLISN